MNNHLEATQYNEMSTGFAGMLGNRSSADDVARACVYFRFMKQSAHYLGAKRGQAGGLSLNFDD